MHDLIAMNVHMLCCCSLVGMLGGSVYSLEALFTFNRITHIDRCL
jgi:hypothetical protein